VQRNTATSVLVKLLEERAPGGKETPEVLKLLEGYGGTLWLIWRRVGEHAHQRRDRPAVKWREVGVD